MPEEASSRIRVRHRLAEDKRTGCDDDAVFRSGRDWYRRGQIDVLLAGAVSHWSDRGEEFVCGEVPQLDGCRAGALEVEVEPADVVGSWCERLAVAKRVNRRVGYRLLLIGNAIGAGAVRSEEHIPPGWDLRNSSRE
jgi:hypothetical protein